MASRCVFFLSAGGYEAGWQAASLVLTAVAMGETVVVIPSSDALRAVARGTYGSPLNDREKAAAKRGEKMGAPTPARMLEQARSLGARLIACDTTVKLCGLDPATLEKAGSVDEVSGLPSIWKLTAGARVFSW